jgi:hypothetical protein
MKKKESNKLKVPIVHPKFRDMSRVFPVKTVEKKPIKIRWL